MTQGKLPVHQISTVDLNILQSSTFKINNLNILNILHI